MTTTTTTTATEFAARRESYERLREAVRGYGFAPGTVIRAGAGYRVDGPTGPHFLKRFNHSPAEALFVYHSLEHLRSHGLPEAPRIHLTRDGQPFIAPGGDLYYLQDWQDLSPADLTDPASLGAAVDLLGRMHRSGEGFEPPPESADVRNDYGSWLDKCVGRLRELYSFAELAEDGRKESKFDARYAKASLGFARQAEESVRRLADLPLARIAERERDAGALCHRNYSPSNLALDSRSRLRILDFDNCAREIRLDDVAKFLRRASGQDLDRAAFILDRYAQAAGQAWSEQELALLSAYLLFPTEFWSVGNSRFRKDRRRERALRRTIDGAEAWASFAGAVRDIKLSGGAGADSSLTGAVAAVATGSLAAEAGATPAGSGPGELGAIPVPDGPQLPSVPFAASEAPPAEPLGLLRFDTIAVQQETPAPASFTPPDADVPQEWLTPARDTWQPAEPWVEPLAWVPPPCWQHPAPAMPAQPVAQQYYQWSWPPPGPAEAQVWVDPTAETEPEVAEYEPVGGWIPAGEHQLDDVVIPEVEALTEEVAVPYDPGIAPPQAAVGDDDARLTEMQPEEEHVTPVASETAPEEPPLDYPAAIAEEEAAIPVAAPSRPSTLVWGAWPKPLTYDKPVESSDQ